jgi:hypothetical protein
VDSTQAASTPPSSRCQLGNVTPCSCPSFAVRQAVSTRVSKHPSIDHSKSGESNTCWFARVWCLVQDNRCHRLLNLKQSSRETNSNFVQLHVKHVQLVSDRSRDVAIYTNQPNNLPLLHHTDHTIHSAKRPNGRVPVKSRLPSPVGSAYRCPRYEALFGFTSALSTIHKSCQLSCGPNP